jgi:ATP-binding cassette subfamily B protein
MLEKLLPFLGEYKRDALLSPLMVICEVILEIFIPFLIAKIIDVGIANKDLHYVSKIGGLMVVMALLALFFGALAGRFAAVAGTGFAKRLRQGIFLKIQDFSFANIDKFSTASLVTRLTTDVTNAQNALMLCVRVLVRAPIMLISASIMAIAINARLSSVVLIAIPVLGTALAVISVKAFPRFQRMLKKYDAMNSLIQENLIAIRVVKAFVRRDYENEKFTAAAGDLQRAQLYAEKLIIINMPLMVFTMYACIVAIVWFGGHMIVRGQMQTGELIGFISYLSQILMSLMILSMVFVGVVMSKASLSRIVEVLDEEPELTDLGTNPQLEVKDGSINFENVSFSYAKDNSNLTLTEVNFQIKSGETVGIIGGTGSAKTTLVQLIPRLYDVLAGRILVGGRDVREYSLRTLREAVAMVLQKNVLFSGTIKENLMWGNAAASDEEIQAVCKIAQAHDFILSFPNGYETQLGQGGVNLSGGQKQRLCIARALLKKPKIIIFDDSTSAVDTATDRLIRQGLRQNLAETTTIIIAQRIASVSSADKIIVLDDGRINAIGTHSELLISNEIYREVYESQQRGVA